MEPGKNRVGACCKPTPHPPAALLSDDDGTALLARRWRSIEPRRLCVCGHDDLSHCTLDLLQLGLLGGDETSPQRRGPLGERSPRPLAGPDRLGRPDRADPATSAGRPGQAHSPPPNVGKPLHNSWWLESRPRILGRGGAGSRLVKARPAPGKIAFSGGLCFNEADMVTFHGCG